MCLKIYHTIYTTHPSQRNFTTQHKFNVAYFVSFTHFSWRTHVDTHPCHLPEFPIFAIRLFSPYYFFFSVILRLTLFSHMTSWLYPRRTLLMLFLLFVLGSLRRSTDPKLAILFMRPIGYWLVMVWSQYVFEVLSKKTGLQDKDWQMRRSS